MTHKQIARLTLTPDIERFFRANGLSRDANGFIQDSDGRLITSQYHRTHVPAVDAWFKRYTAYFIGGDDPFFESEHKWFIFAHNAGNAITFKGGIPSYDEAYEALRPKLRDLYQRLSPGVFYDLADQFMRDHKPGPVEQAWASLPAQE